MRAPVPVRLVLWSDALPAGHPADAVLERVPWATRPEHVASRAQGLGAHAITVWPPEGVDVALALSSLRPHTVLPLCLLVTHGRAPGGLRSGLEPVRMLRDLEPRTVGAALAKGAAERANPGWPTRGEVRMDPVVAVFAPSGGAGASTLAVALGRTLAASGLPTVVLDLNLHAPTLSVLLQTWSAGEPAAVLERYLRDPSLAPLPVHSQPGLGLVPGLEALRNLDDVSVGGVVALLERLRGSVRVVDTAPVLTDPAVYAALRSATRTVLVADDRATSRLQLRRYRRLFPQIGLAWRDALLVINQPRPASSALTPAQIEEEIGLRPLATLPYRMGLGSRGGSARPAGSWRAGIERVAATVVGRPLSTGSGRRRAGPHSGR